MTSSTPRLADTMWERFVYENPAPTWLTRQGRITSANNAAVRLLEAKGESDLLGTEPPLVESSEDPRSNSDDDRQPRETSLRTIADQLVPVRLFSFSVPGNRTMFQALPLRVLLEEPEAGESVALLVPAEELRHGMLASTTDCIKILSLDGRLIYINPGGLSLMAMEDPAAILGSSWLDFWKDEHRDLAEQSLLRAGEGKVGRFVGACLALDGTTRWWDVVISPLRDSQKRVSNLLAICRDVTVLKQSQQLELAERQVLENIASDRPMPDTLDRICKLLEARVGAGVSGSVLVCQDTRRDLMRVASSPSRPLLGSELLSWKHFVGSRPFRQALLGRAEAGHWEQAPILGPDQELLGRIVVWKQTARPVDRSVLSDAANLAAIALARDTFLRRLRSKQDRLAALYRAAPVGLYQVDENQNWVFANERHAQMTGLTPEECVEEGWLRSVHAQDRGAVRKAWLQARSTRSEFFTEYRLAQATADAEERWVVAIETPAFAMPGRVGTITDVTEMKRAQAARLETEQQFQLLANNISQFCWMADAKGWVYWYNQRWYDYTGTTLEQMQGWGWRAVHHPDHVDRVVASISHSWDTGELWDDTFPLRGKDGQYRWFLSRAVPIRDAEGRVTRWFGTNTDITEIRDLEHTLQDQNRSLQRSNEDLSRFAFFASHDLQEPLRSIVSFSELARRDSLTGDSSSALERLDIVIHATKRMERLVRDLLRYAQTSADVDPPSGPVNVAQIVKQVLKELDADIRAASAHVEVKTLPVVRCNEDQLAQVIHNFLSNALKYRRPDVPLRVEIRGEQISSSESKILVQDNGQGFESEHAQHVFEFLRRLHGRAVSGSGIGLAICKTIVERHGGHVGAEAKPGEGATFWFTLHSA